MRSENESREGIRMKPTMLLVSQSPTTSVGLKNYLNHIFGKYIQIEAFLVENVDTALMEKYDFVLFASKSATTRLRPLLTEGMHSLTCSRTLNFTYLYKILSIPPNSYVYLANDSRSSALLAIRLLNTFGITQYHFLPWYPECKDINYDIQYAVTLGELRFVPRHIATVVDIGVRVADISTIAEIISFFNLPMSLADVVTNNYINQFVRLLKTSNHQLSQTVNKEFITQSIISSIDTGICILDEAGMIKMVNSKFSEALEIQQPGLVGTLIEKSLPELAEILKKPLAHQSAHRIIHREGGGGLMLTVQEIQDADHKKLLMIHSKDVFLADSDGKISETAAEPDTSFYHFSDYHTANEHVIQMLEAAKRISLTDYRVLIQGETGTGKTVLAQAIHNNSNRSRGPFVRLNLSALSKKRVLEALNGTGEDGGIISRAEGGTLYLDGIHHLTIRLQKEILRILDEKPNVRFIASADCSLYEKCEAGQFQKELFYKISEVSIQTVPIRERKEDIALLFEYFMQNIYNNSELSLSGMCGESLWNQLMEYQWPGNGKEIENLCKHFYCVRSEGKLTFRNLPSYMREQMAKKGQKLAPLDRQILNLVKQNPRIGRYRLKQMMEQQGVVITEDSMRSTLHSLAGEGLIRMNRTRGGCEITEEGLYYL